MINSGDIFRTPDSAAVVRVDHVGLDWVTLSINTQSLHSGDLKALRKFLKKLQKQLESEGF